MYTLDENHHEEYLNIHWQGFHMIKSGAVKSSKNKDPNESSIPAGPSKGCQMDRKGCH